jgi:hypothetical protein
LSTDEFTSCLSTGNLDLLDALKVCGREARYFVGVGLSYNFSSVKLKLFYKIWTSAVTQVERKE